MPPLQRKTTKNRIVNWSGSQTGMAVSKTTGKSVPKPGYEVILDDSQRVVLPIILYGTGFMKCCLLAYMTDMQRIYGPWLLDAFNHRKPMTVAEYKTLNALLLRFGIEHCDRDEFDELRLKESSPYRNGSSSATLETADDELVQWIEWALSDEEISDDIDQQIRQRLVEQSEERLMEGKKAHHQNILRGIKSVRKRRREEIEEKKRVKKRRIEVKTFNAEIKRIWTRWRSEKNRKNREMREDRENRKDTVKKVVERRRKHEQIHMEEKRRREWMAKRLEENRAAGKRLRQQKAVAVGAQQEGQNQAEDAVSSTNEEMIEEQKEEGAEPAGTGVFPILELPNEVLSMIFRKFTQRELRPVALTCRKFHGIRLDLGRNHFTTITIDWTDMFRYLSCIHGNIRYRLVAIGADLPKDGQREFNKIGIFKKPKTDLLEIKFRLFNDELPPYTPRTPANPFILNMLDEVYPKKLKVTFSHDDRMHYTWLTRTLLYDIKELVGIRDIAFTWDGKSTHNVYRARRFLRRALRQLFVSLKLEWMLVDGRVPTTISEGQECLMDDDLLWFLACNGGNVELNCMGNYTVDGILRVFEMFCRVSVYKTLSFYAQKDVIDEIFAINNYVYYKVKQQQGYVRYLVDHDTVLTASRNKIWISQERLSSCEDV